MADLPVSWQRDNNNNKQYCINGKSAIQMLIIKIMVMIIIIISVNVIIIIKFAVPCSTN